MTSKKPDIQAEEAKLFVEAVRAVVDTPETAPEEEKTFAEKLEAARLDESPRGNTPAPDAHAASSESFRERLAKILERSPMETSDNEK